MNTLRFVVTLCHGRVKNKDGVLEPTKSGKQRLVSSSKELISRPTFAHIICGGSARIYADWINGLYPNLSDRVIVLPTLRNTPENAKGLAQFLRDETWRLHSDLSLTSLIPEVIFSTHPDHAILATISLHHYLSEPYFGVEIGCVPSGEDPPYPKWIQTILYKVTDKDAGWETWRGKPLRWLTSLRGDPA